MGVIKDCCRKAVKIEIGVFILFIIIIEGNTA